MVVALGVGDGVHRAREAVVDHNRKMVWSSALPMITSVQKAELITLFEALERAEGRWVTVYTAAGMPSVLCMSTTPIYQK